jgi:hypothetical protein
MFFSGHSTILARSSTEGEIWSKLPQAGPTTVQIQSAVGDLCPGFVDTCSPATEMSETTTQKTNGHSVSRMAVKPMLFALALLDISKILDAVASVEPVRQSHCRRTPFVLEHA